MLPAARRSDLAAGLRSVEHLVAQLVQAAHGDQQLGRVVQLDADLAAILLAGGDGDLVVAGLADVQTVDLLVLVLAVAVLPVDEAAQLRLGEALHGPAVDDQVEAVLATTATARGLAGGGLGLGLGLMHGCLLVRLGRVRDPMDPFCTFFGHA